MSGLGEHLLRFIAHLRAAGIRISVAESLDGMAAVAAAGLERARMREALAAALIKDEADRPAFDRAFVRFFGAPPAARIVPRRKNRAGMAGEGGRNQSAPGFANRPGREPESRAAGTEIEQSSTQDGGSRSARAGQKNDPREARDAVSEEPDVGRKQTAEAGERFADAGVDGVQRLRALERTPFELYSEGEYEAAREALLPLKRRFRIRLGRRLKPARRGRLDFRRTIRAAIQHGGAPADLRWRSNRPRHIDLVLLADISGSVRYSSTLMIEIAAGARALFHRVRTFAFIDRLAEADFEQGHLVMTPALDLYARSDFGRVLGELFERRGELLGRAAVLVIMGDGRNNRRPARADLLREIARCCRAVIWLNPEAPARWGSGDSAMDLYAREVTALVASGTLGELEAGLLRIA